MPHGSSAYHAACYTICGPSSLELLVFRTYCSARDGVAVVTVYSVCGIRANWWRGGTFTALQPGLPDLLLPACCAFQVPGSSCKKRTGTQRFQRPRVYLFAVHTALPLGYVFGEEHIYFVVR
jgi:hypothetical protein